MTRPLHTSTGWIKAVITFAGADPDDVAAVTAYDLGLAVEVGDSGLTLWLDDVQATPESVHEIANSLRAQFPDAVFHPPVIENHANEDWLKKWKESFTPLPVGQSLMIIPSWWNGPIPENKKIITLDPGMAFGTGHHAATAMLMEALETRSTGFVLDLGCGSGILAIVAALCGAERVIGVDNDPEATVVAHENVEINGIAGKVEIRDGAIGDLPETGFDVIAANLFLNALTQLAQALYGKLRKGGVLLASGLRREQAYTAMESFDRAGLVMVERIDRDEWTALIMRRP